MVATSLGCKEMGTALMRKCPTSLNSSRVAFQHVQRRLVSTLMNYFWGGDWNNRSSVRYHLHRHMQFHGSEFIIVRLQYHNTKLCMAHELHQSRNKASFYDDVNAIVAAICQVRDSPACITQDILVTEVEQLD